MDDFVYNAYAILEALVILFVLRAVYSNFEFILELDTVYIMQRKETKSSFYFVLVVSEAKVETSRRLRNTGKI